MEEKIKKLSVQLGLPAEVIKNTYKAYWKFIRTTISGIDFSDGLTEDEFKKIRTSFNIPYIGKFNCSYKHYLVIKNGNKHKKDKADVQSGDHNNEQIQ